MEEVLNKEEFMELVYRDIERKRKKEEQKEKGIKAANAHMCDNYTKIRRRMSKYKKSYRVYD